MTIVQKGIKVRLYPTEKQEILINKTLGCCRFVHNQTLSDCKQSYEQTQHFPSQNERIKNLVPLKEAHEFLKEIDAAALQQSVRDLNSAFDNFFNGQINSCHKRSTVIGIMPQGQSLSLTAKDHFLVSNQTRQAN